MEKASLCFGRSKKRSALYPENDQGILRILKKHGINVSKYRTPEYKKILPNT